jgi:hypothetical protein
MALCLFILYNSSWHHTFAESFTVIFHNHRICFILQVKESEFLNLVLFADLTTCCLYQTQNCNNFCLAVVYAVALVVKTVPLQTLKVYGGVGV